MKPAKVKMWIVITETGFKELNTLSTSKKGSIAAHEQVWDNKWAYWYSNGYRCKKVFVTIEGIKS